MTMLNFTFLHYNCSLLAILSSYAPKMRVNSLCILSGDSPIFIASGF